VVFVIFWAQCDLLLPPSMLNEYVTASTRHLSMMERRAVWVTGCSSR